MRGVSATPEKLPPPPAEQPQQVNEQVHKRDVKRQRAVDRERLALRPARVRELLERLRLVGREARKDEAKHNNVTGALLARSEFTMVGSGLSDHAKLITIGSSIS